MIMATIATKKQTGLSIARAGRRFTLSWKKGDSDYGAGQSLQYRLSTAEKKWIDLPISSGSTSKTVSLTMSAFYPTTKKKLLWIEFRLCGKKSLYTEKGVQYVPTVSDYAVKRMSFDIPKRPTLKASLGATDNVCNFVWGVATKATDDAPFTYVQYQSILVASTETNGEKLKWKSTNPGWKAETNDDSAHTLTITEDSAVLLNKAYVRWVRVRSVGPAGVSKWRYAKHVYAAPYAAKIKTVGYKVSDTTTIVEATWTAQKDGLHPIDKTALQYVIATPATGFVVPAGASWSTISTTSDTSGADAARGVISDVVGFDECLWVRVLTYHDNTFAASAAKLVQVGKLTAPTLTSAVADDATHQVTVTAENNSDVPDSRLAVIYRPASEASAPVVVGIMSGTTATVQCPDWSQETAYAIGVQAFQGKATSKGGIYAIVANMQSDAIYNAGDIPTAAQNVTVSQSETPGEAILEWDWSWASATAAEISWSSNPNAWESTTEPNVYTVTRLHSPLWRVSELEVGIRHYFRVRLIQELGDNNFVYAPYSDTVALDLSSAPQVPILTASDAVITESASVTLSWIYAPTDGTPQAQAEICDENDTIIARAETATAVDINAEVAGWQTGETHELRVRVTSGSGNTSDWSDPAQVSVADPVACSIDTTSLVDSTVEDITTYTLTALPLSITLDGVAEDNTVNVVIERAEDYQMDRPDESVETGYQGEAVVIYSQVGSGAISIDQTDLVGRLDDGALYRLIVIASDNFGQRAEDSVDFEVGWAHQAIIPAGTAVIDDSQLIAVITPTAPTGYVSGDTCDIYRLSADRPRLVCGDCAFGTAYVDPFPAIGEQAGYRIVYRTATGDYTTADGDIAWLDLEAGLNIDRNIIDFGKGRVLLGHNIALSSSWKKDFKETRYLGGSIAGDWNTGVSRTGSVGGVIVTDDPETIAGLRRLADYPGICHVRTVDGSSYPADVQVSEDRGNSKIVSFRLSITRVDSEGYEGMTEDEWDAMG